MNEPTGRVDTRADLTIEPDPAANPITQRRGTGSTSKEENGAQAARGFSQIEGTTRHRQEHECNATRKGYRSAETKH